MSLKTSIIYAGLAAGIAAALVVPSTMPTPWRAPVLLADSLNCNVSQTRRRRG